MGDIPAAPADPFATRIAQSRKIPLERMCHAMETFSKGEVVVRRGGRYDVDDEIVRLEPGLFRLVDGSPVPPDVAA